MLIIKLQGGLGNQMFQYAFYYSLSKVYQNIIYDCSYYKGFQSHNGYELEKAFGIKEHNLSILQLNKLSDLKLGKIYSLKRRLFRKKTHYIEKINDYFHNLNKIMTYSESAKDYFIDGYWNDYRYFAHLEDEIIDQFKFPKIVDNKNKSLKKMIMKSNSISIHVRRGDKVNSLLHLILGMDYYIEAVKIIENIIDNPKYFIFSDDYVWTRKMFGDLNIKITYVDWNKDNNSYIDMQLMSLCKHNIIAPSSFSWWAAYLNTNKNKIIITPMNQFTSKFRHLENDYSIPDSWIKI